MKMGQTVFFCHNSKRPLKNLFVILLLLLLLLSSILCQTYETEGALKYRERSLNFPCKTHHSVLIVAIQLPTLLIRNFYVTVLGAFAKLQKATFRFIMSVRPPAWNSCPTGRIFIKI
jgi:hypothetical protein